MNTPCRALRMRHLVHQKNLGCPAQIYKLIQENKFPKPFKIGRGSYWVESEIDDWIKARMAERDAQYGDGSEAVEVESLGHDGKAKTPPRSDQGSA